MAVLWNRNDFLRFRFRLWKNFCSGSCSSSSSGSGSGSGQYLAQFFNIKKFVHNLAPFKSAAALFPRKLASQFGFFDLTYVGSGSKAGSGTGAITVMQSGSGSCGSGSTTLLNGRGVAQGAAWLRVRRGFGVRRGSDSWAFACCKAGPSSNLGLAPERKQ